MAGIDAGGDEIKRRDSEVRGNESKDEGRGLQEAMRGVFVCVFVCLLWYALL